MWVANNRDRYWKCDGPSRDAVAFHRSLDGYQPTPLLEAPELAKALGVGRVLLKDESNRLGLPAFKALGASWAINRSLQSLPAGEQVCVVTATDGNHGRAVAKFSRKLGHTAKIVIPSGVHPAAIKAIEDEGAEVFCLEGSYDDAVARAAEIGMEPGHILVQDTAWEGYEEIPTWIVEGYTTMFVEIDDQLRATGVQAPDLVIVPVGVGSLLQGALTHYRSSDLGLATRVISVEPDNAACMVASLAAGEATAVPTDVTVMAGLNCGTPSTLAWPYVKHGLDGAITVSDEQDLNAMRTLTESGVAAGPCGASGFAALTEILAGSSDEARHHLALDGTSTVVLIVTEGAEANPRLEE